MNAILQKADEQAKAQERAEREAEIKKAEEAAKQKAESDRRKKDPGYMDAETENSVREWAGEVFKK